MTGLNMKKRMAVALMIIALLISFHGVLLNLDILSWTRYNIPR